MSKTSDMPRMHSREQATNVAASSLELVMLRELDNHDLTDAEALRVIHSAYHGLISSIIKNQIRMERHGNKKDPGGWE